MPWPDFFPSDCPPDKANACDAEVYRLVAGDSPTDRDFVSNWELFPKKYTEAERCKACGLSVHTSQEGVESVRKIFGFFRNHRIAVGILRSDHGRMCTSPPDAADSHCTWWAYDGVDKKALFQIVDES